MTNIKRLREAAGLSQSQLAEKAGVSKRTLQEYEQGRKDINGTALKTAVALAKTLRCRPEELME